MTLFLVRIAKYFPSLYCTGTRSSMEGSAGQDILSIARSRRSSSVDASRDSLLFNARDSLCAEPQQGLGQGSGDSADAGFSCGRPSELIPPLPSRQIMSMR